MISLKTFRSFFAEAPVIIPDSVLEEAYVRLIAELEKPVENVAQDILAWYISEYEAIFGKRPIFESKDTKRLKQFSQSINPQRMKHLVSVYFDMKDPMFVERGHDLFTFMNNLNRIARAADAPPPAPVLPTTNKPHIEYHPIKEIVIAVPPPPDLLKNLKKSLASMPKMPDPKASCGEEQREKLRRQMAELKKKGG